MIGTSVVLNERQRSRLHQVVVYGQVGINYATGYVDPHVPQQFNQAILNLDSKLRERGANLSNVVALEMLVPNANIAGSIDNVFAEIWSRRHHNPQKIKKTYRIVGFPADIGLKLELKAIANIALHQTVL